MSKVSSWTRSNVKPNGLVWVILKKIGQKKLPNSDSFKCLQVVVKLQRNQVATKTLSPRQFHCLEWWLLALAWWSSRVVLLVAASLDDQRSCAAATWSSSLSTHISPTQGLGSFYFDEIHLLSVDNLSNHSKKNEKNMGLQKSEVAKENGFPFFILGSWVRSQPLSVHYCYRETRRLWHSEWPGVSKSRIAFCMCI